MPSRSQAENRFMHAVASNPALAKKKGVPQSVAQEFLKADQGTKVSSLPERVESQPSPLAVAKRADQEHIYQSMKASGRAA